MPERLRMSSIRKSFGGAEVLSNVVLAVDEGEIVGLLGANGAGKSTLVKILSGIYAMDSGQISLDGLSVRITSPIDAIARGVRMLPQELSIHPDLSVAENMFVNDPPCRRFAGVNLVDRKTMRSKAHEILGDLGLGDVDPALPMKRLRAPEQRVVEIARAIAGDARVLVMDEPTAALSEPEVKRLFDVLRRLSAQGVSVIYISHYLDEIFSICQRVIVLRDGRNAGDFPIATSTHHDVLQAMLGNVVADLYPPGAAQPGESILTVKGLTVGRDLDQIDFAVQRGEIFGVFGLIGSGLSQIGRAVYGSLGRPDGGTMTLDDQLFAPTDPGVSTRAGIGFIGRGAQARGHRRRIKRPRKHHTAVP